ncbi:MAG: RNA polymerase sigma factor RpoD/SigA [Acidobacteriota bacterium]
MTHFLWGDLPPLREAGATSPQGPMADSPDVPRAISAAEGLDETANTSSTTPSFWNEASPAADLLLNESTPVWDAATARRLVEPVPSAVDPDDDTDEPVDEPETDTDIDIDTLAALAGLSGDPEFDEASSPPMPGDDSDEIPVDERPLTYGQLTERLERRVLPRLRAIAAEKGYLTLGHLARAVVDLHGSDPHLNDLHAFVERLGVTILPSRSHQVGRFLPLAAVRHANRRFADLLGGQIDDHVVIDRFGYVGVPLSAGTRAFLVQAWMGHCLSRAEERVYAQVVSMEAARVGECLDCWSEEALAAREALILDNLWLVARMARKYMNHGIEIDDLLQVGIEGLFRAEEKFEVERGYRFVTYASSWVYQSIMRHIAVHSRLIRLPVHLFERGQEIDVAAAELRQTLERDPTLTEIAAAIDSNESLVRAHLVTSRPVSLDASPQVRILAESLPDRDDPEAIAEAAELTDVLDRVFATITNRERDILERRFGLIDGKSYTLEQIGRRYGVTRERIRQIEDKALKRVRHPSRKKLLREFVDEPRMSLGVQVSAADARRQLAWFSAQDQRIIRLLWGLDGPQARSLRAAAIQLGVSVARVQEVSEWVVALHRTQPVRRVALSPPETTTPRVHLMPSKRGSIHPRWQFSTADKNASEWASRLATEGVATKTAFMASNGLRRAIDSNHCDPE